MSEIQSVSVSVSVPVRVPSRVRAPSSRTPVSRGEPTIPLRPDPSGISVRQAVSPADVEKVFDLRWQSYKKHFDARDEVVETRDSAINATLLLATNVCDRPLGTLRILDRGQGEIELDDFLDVDSLLSPIERPAVEASRFVVPRHPRAEDVLLALWRSFYHHSRAREARTMLIQARPGAARRYRRLGCQNAGPLGEFRHPRLGDLAYRTYKLFVPAAEFLYRRHEHELADFLFGER